MIGAKWLGLSNGKGHKRTRRGWLAIAPPPPNFSNDNFRAKPLDIRASNGENIRTRDHSQPHPAPERNWSDLIRLCVYQIEIEGNYRTCRRER